MARTAIAIEFESTAVKVVRVRVAGNKWQPLHAAVVPLGEVERYPEGEARSNAMAKLLVDALPHDLRSEPVVVGLSGRAVMLRFVQAPPVTGHRLETLMNFEAESQAVGSRGGLAYDYLPLDVSGPGGTRLVALAVAQLNTISGNSAVLKRTGIKSHTFSLSALGLAAAYRNSVARPGETVLLVDIGYNNISVVLVRDGEFTFSRSVAGGSSRIQQSLVESLNIPRSEAAEIVSRRARVMSEEELSHAADREKTIHRAVSGGLSIIGGAIQSTILFARNQISAPDLTIDRVLICGGTSLIHGSDSIISASLGLPVEIFNPFVYSSSPSEAAPERLASVAGLALSAAGLGSTLDLRSQQEREHERYRRHDRYLWFAVPALSLFVIASILALWFYTSTYQSYASELKVRISREQALRSSFDNWRAELDEKRVEREFVLAKTSGSVYFMEIMKLVKEVLDREENLSRFETLFFESMALGEKDKKTSKNPDNRFGPRAVPGAGASGSETVEKYPPVITLTGWCRSRRGSEAIELARLFCLELIKREDMIRDFQVRNIERMDVDEPGWRNMLQIKFEIVLFMKR